MGGAGCGLNFVRRGPSLSHLEPQVDQGLVTGRVRKLEQLPHGVTVKAL